jgi:Raf kinase inhibitor-like YbhB/YbcL family protein
MGRLWPLLATLGVLALALGCGGGDEPQAVAPVAGLELGGGDVEEGGTIAARFTCDGDDVSPQLAWSRVPEETRELALVLDDPDADGFTHWLVYGMRPSAMRLPPRVQPVPQVTGPTPLLQGVNDFGRTGYAGPCPPPGETHTYVFRLLALDSELGLEPGADRAALDDASEGHVIGEARLEAQYTRE